MDKSTNISVAKGMEPQLTSEGQTLKQPGDPVPSARTDTTTSSKSFGSSSIGSTSAAASTTSGPTEKDVTVASAMEPSLTSEGFTLQQPGDSTTASSSSSDKTSTNLFGGSADEMGAGQVRPGDSVGSVKNVNTFGKDAREKLDDTADSAGDKLQGAADSVTHFVSQAYEGAKAAVEKIGEKVTGTTNAPTPDEELQMKVAHDPAFKANSNDV